MRPHSSDAVRGLRTLAGWALLGSSALAPCQAWAQAPTPAPAPAPPNPSAPTPEPPPIPPASRVTPAPMPPVPNPAARPTSPPASRGRVRMPDPQPHLPAVEQRSGLIERFVPIEPTLPHDKYRDTFYDTRWADHPDKHPYHPNQLDLKQGGLYGRFWPAYNTASFYPYFFGSPGNTLGPGSKPWPRFLRGPQAFLQPFRPVGYYYDQGSLVPVYDTDPLVPGPGQNPYFFPFYPKLPLGH